jgi:hypothetical protein
MPDVVYRHTSSSGITSEGDETGTRLGQLGREAE